MGRKDKEVKEKKNKSIFGLFKKSNSPSEPIEVENADGVVAKVAINKKLKVIIPVAIVILIVIAVVLIMIKINRNDGERIALSLSERLGSTAEKAAINADVKLKKTSEYDFINNIGEFSDVYESEDTVKINGINVPKWVILCYSDKSGKLEEVSYFNYNILKKNVNGIKAPKKIDISKIKDGTTIEEVEETLNLEPIQVIRSNDDKKIYKYKYYYEDSKTKDEKPYYITIMLNFDDKVMAVKETQDNYITEVLSLE